MRLWAPFQNRLLRSTAARLFQDAGILPQIQLAPKSVAGVLWEWQIEKLAHYKGQKGGQNSKATENELNMSWLEKTTK